MHRLACGTIAVVGLLAGFAFTAPASATIRVMQSARNTQTAAVERVDYYYNHHHYRHRSWDRRHHRWHYY